MLKKITEKEMIGELGIGGYSKFMSDLATKIMSYDVFKKSNDLYFFSCDIFPLEEKVFEKYSFMLVTSTINKTLAPLMDFGLHSAYLANDEKEIIDKQLDVYNEYKKKGANLSFIK